MSENVNDHLILGSLLKEKRPKTKFTSDEDNMILKLVEIYGDENWALIASKMKGRSTRQCRERYRNYLSPTVNNSPWTSDEDTLLYKRYERFGPKWKLIADGFNNRTDINIKNRWLLLERHRKRSFVSSDCSSEAEPVYPVSNSRAERSERIVRSQANSSNDVVVMAQVEDVPVKIVENVQTSNWIEPVSLASFGNDFDDLASSDANEYFASIFS